MDYGDGSGVQPLTLNADKTFTLSHPYDQTGTFTITVSVRDDDGGVGTATRTVTVNNNRPVVRAGADASLLEGDTLTRSGQFFGGPDDTFTATVNYGDGSGSQPLSLNANKTFTLSHTYADNGNFVVRVQVTNQKGEFGTDEFTAVVSNVRPTITLGSAVSINEGDTFISTGRFTDPGADTWTATVDYGDGSGVRPLVLNADKTFSLTHTYADNGSFTVTVRVQDKDLEAGTATQTINVANVRPAVSLLLGDKVSLPEGSALSSGGSFVDPGADTWTATVDYGDGAGSQPLALTIGATKTFNLGNTYRDNGVYTITVRVTDDDGETGIATLTVTVTNVPPRVNVGGDVSLNEGDTLLSAGNFTDPGADTWTATVDYGDGAGRVPLTLNADRTFNLSHLYQTAGLRTVRVVVRDDDGDEGVATFNVTVRPVEPALGTAAPVTINEGATYQSSGFFTDPGANTWTATVNYGDGSGVQPLVLNANRTFQLSHLYQDNGAYTITIAVQDSEGLVGIGTRSVTVLNVAPSAEFSGATISEGDTFRSAGRFTDPGADTWTATVNYGDGSIPVEQTLSLNPDKTFNLNHLYGDDGSYVITVKVRDDDGDIGTATFTLVVASVSPRVNLGGNVSLNEGDTLSAGGAFTDPGADSWTATVNFGDGSGVVGLNLNVDKSLLLNHRFAQDGVYTVTVKVTDDEGHEGLATLRVNVANVAPSLTLPNELTLNEGDSIARDGSFFDPGADIWVGTINYGDGLGEKPLTLTGKSFTLSHSYAQDGDYLVTVTIRDDGQVPGIHKFTAHVLDVAPVVALGGPVTINEGDTFQSLGSFFDPGADTWSATINFGSGPVPLTLAADRRFNFDHTFTRNGSYIVEVRVVDQAGKAGTGTVEVLVNNVSPFVRAGGPATIFEGETFEGLSAFQDPGAQTWIATIDYGDGSEARRLDIPSDIREFLLQHFYENNSVYTVTVQVRDSDGGLGEDAIQVHVVNLPPLLQVAPVPEESNTGQFVTEGSTFDASRKTVAVFVDYGDGTGMQPLAVRPDNTFTLVHDYEKSGTYFVKVQAVDKDAAVTETLITVLVNLPIAPSGQFLISLPPRPIVLETPAVTKDLAPLQPDNDFLPDDEESFDSFQGGESQEADEDDRFWPWLEGETPPSLPEAEGGQDAQEMDMPTALARVLAGQRLQTMEPSSKQPRNPRPERAEAADDQARTAPVSPATLHTMASVHRDDANYEVHGAWAAPESSNLKLPSPSKSNSPGGERF